ncbi:MAG: hypothetical protein NVS2B16_03970 [Chloroflexota bacterium]
MDLSDVIEVKDFTHAAAIPQQTVERGNKPHLAILGCQIESAKSRCGRMTPGRRAFDSDGYQIP